MTINDNKLKFNYEPGYRNSTKYIILHHTASKSATVEQVHEWHLSKGWAGIAYHFFIRKDGTIYKGRDLDWIGGHTTGYNSISIGVCFEGNFENEYMSDAQIDAGNYIINYIKIYYPNVEVRKHSDFNNTVCPGKNFPFDMIVNGFAYEPEDTNVEHQDDPSVWAYNYCNDMINRGIFKGDGTNYNWHDYVTREELAIVAFRILESLK